MRLNFFPLLFAISMVALSLSCTSKPPHRPRLDADGGDASKGDNPTTEDTEQTKDLELLPTDGSKMRLMDGRALTTVYGRVFKKDEWGYAHCAQLKTQDYDGCNIIFNKDEKPGMGVFDLYSQRMGRGTQNVLRAEDLTLNYMRNLRAALGRECERLISNEEKALAENPTASTLFVKAKGPTAADLEAYFKKLMDTEGNSIDFEVPYASYVETFQKVQMSVTDKSKATHIAYVSLCLAISMEPQVFIY